MKELISKVEKWAEDRNLIKGATPIDQFMKLAQEAGELSDSICKDKDAKDDIGDNMVVLIILCLQQGTDPHDMWLTATKESTADIQGLNIKELFLHYSIFASAIAGSLVIDDFDLMNESIRDAMILIMAMSDELGLDFEECLQVAYDDIKDRKGVMRDGVFIKQADLDELSI